VKLFRTFGGRAGPADPSVSAYFYANLCTAALKLMPWPGGNPLTVTASVPPWVRSFVQSGGNLALPRDEAEVSYFNGLKKGLGSSCPIAFQSVSERLPKLALKATKAEPRRQYCKLTDDGTHNFRFGAILS
jgi:hypothetical protein